MFQIDTIKPTKNCQIDQKLLNDILKGVEGIEFIYMDRGDVVRHRLVKDIIQAYDQYHKQNNNQNLKGVENDIDS